MLIGLIPVYNEEERIVGVLDSLAARVDAVVVVDDGSTDASASLIAGWAEGRRNVFAIRLGRNRGMAGALRRGFEFVLEQRGRGMFSDSDAVVTVDGDGQHDPAQIAGAAAWFELAGLDVLIGKRDFDGYPGCRVAGNRLLTTLARVLGRHGFSDIECGFKILSVRFIAELMRCYTGVRYSCAGEIGIAAAVLGYKLDNTYPVEAPYLGRPGPGWLDLLINVSLDLTVFFRAEGYLLTRKSPIARNSMPDPAKLRAASPGVQTIGSGPMLNEVLSTTGTPVISPNARISPR